MIQRAPQSTAHLLNQALAHRNAGRRAEVFRICRELVENDPRCADAWFLMGVTHWDQGDAALAEQSLTRALTVDGGNSNYHNALGLVWIDAGRFKEAEEILRRAIVTAGPSTDLHCNLGRALMRQGRLDEAQQCFNRVLTLDADHAPALANLAVIHQSRYRWADAVTCYRRALARSPRQPDWWANLGAALLSLGRYDPAQSCFETALEVSPGHSTAAKGLGVTCCALGRYEAAAAVLEGYLQNVPDDAEAVASLAIVYQHTAHWAAYERILPRLARQTAEALERGELPAEQPLFNISRSDDPRLNLAVAGAWSRAIAKRVRRYHPPFEFRTPDRGDRIHIGYLSADFRNHAVAHQLVDFFELHDRRNFNISCFSVGPQVYDDYRRRIASTCDGFHDLSSLDAFNAARIIHDQGIDLLIDLMGHTRQNRQEICALRPAPVQIGYLGFLASSGADYIDYIVGDAVVTPDQHAPCFTEKIIRLPHCYQIISSPPASERILTRQDVHLPADAFVFCCFNQAYKIEPAIFGSWMRILREVPDAVLWLYRSDEGAMGRLQAEAHRHGVRPERLIFGDKLSLGDHLARLRLADVALDTPMYNGGATTANALAAGVPVITMMGRHFVSRMSASHLVTLGLPELIAADLPAYENAAIELARMPAKLTGVKQRLQRGLADSPLMDAGGFVRNLEKAFGMVWRRYCAGHPPAEIDLSNQGAVDVQKTFYSGDTANNIMKE